MWGPYDPFLDSFFDVFYIVCNKIILFTVRMSSSVATDTTESVHFAIKDSDLTQFYKTNCGQEFASKALSISNIHFQIYIYPNGHKKEQFGYIQFMVVPWPTTFESNIKSITVRCQLYCGALQVMFKQVQTLHKVSDIIRWLPHRIAAPQPQYTKHLDFVCDIELLRIKYKSNGLRRKLSLHSTRREDSLSLPCMDNVFQPQSSLLKSHVDIVWTISNEMLQLFINASNTTSHYTQTMNSMWSLCVFPNGMTQKDNENVMLLLKLMRLPPEIRSIDVDVEIQSEENHSMQMLHRRREILFNYDKTQEIFPLFTSALLNTMKAFKLKVMIKIIKIYEDIGSKQKGRAVTDSWSIFGYDQFKPRTIHCYDIDHGYHQLIDREKLKRSHSWTSSGLGDILDHTVTDTLNDEDDEKRKSFEYYKTTSSSLLTAPLTSVSRYSSNSITSYRPSVSLPPNVELLDIKEDVAVKDTLKWPIRPMTKQTHLKPEPWSPTSSDVDDHGDNIFVTKFKQWLCEDVQKSQYLEAFKSMGCADIRLIKHFTEDTLLNIGINSEWDRKLLLDEINTLKMAQTKFNDLLDEHYVFRSFKSSLKRHGILTRSDLEHIPDEQALQEILNIPFDDNRIREIWCIIHPSQCRLQSEMNELREQHQVTMDAMDVFLQLMIKMQEKISAEKPQLPNDQTRRIEQQQNGILNAYYARLTQHQSLLHRADTRDISQSKSESRTALSPSQTSKGHGANVMPLNLNLGPITREISDTQLTQPDHSITSHTTSSGGAQSEETYDHSHLCSASQDMTMIKDNSNAKDVLQGDQ
eukprot:505373_1